MKTIEEFSELPNNKRVAVFIRHSDRDKIPDGEFGNEVPINEKGIANAMVFGECLKGYRVNKAYVSPVLRCVQTAEKIRDGYGSHFEIINTKALGDPGLHIENTKSAGDFYIKHGFHEMYKRFIAGDNAPGLYSAKEFSDRMTRFIESNTDNDGITLYVTHDGLVAFYDYCITGKTYTKENWVKYLNGMIIVLD